VLSFTECLEVEPPFKRVLLLSPSASKNSCHSCEFCFHVLAVSNSPFDNIDGGDDDDDLLVNMLAEDEQKTEGEDKGTIYIYYMYIVCVFLYLITLFLVVFASYWYYIC